MATSSITFSRTLPQHAGAPQHEHGAPQFLVVARKLDIVALECVAFVDQPGDLEFARQRALAAHFGRMGGQHRADQRAVEKVAQGGGADACLGGAFEGVGERAGRGSDFIRTWARLRRVWCWSSAMLARWEK